MIRRYLENLKIQWKKLSEKERKILIIIVLFICSIGITLLILWGIFSLRNIDKVVIQSGRDSVTATNEGRRKFDNLYNKLYHDLYGEWLSTTDGARDSNTFFKNVESVHRLERFIEILSDKNKQEYKENKIKFYNDLKIFLQ